MSDKALVAIVAITLVPWRSSEAQVCNPGDLLECVGVDACPGHQTCLDDSTWGACECDPPAGGPLWDGCGEINANWDAPTGAVVVIDSGDTPIGKLIHGIGERFTHSMLSDGADGASQSEMTLPSKTSWPTVCSTPVNTGELTLGWPGASRITLGAAYSDLYSGATHLFNQGYGHEAVQWRAGPEAQRTSDYMRAQTVQAWPSKADRFQEIQRIDRGGWAMPSPYVLYQYRDIEGTHNFGSPSWNNGSVCSTFDAWAHSALYVITPYTYTQPTVGNAAYVLYSSIKDQCNRGLGFWGGLAAIFGCPFHDVCGNAANQVVNCMAFGLCGDSNGTTWRRYYADQATSTAYSISADRLVGWGLNHQGASYWSSDGIHYLRWNQPGGAYGCWK